MPVRWIRTIVAAAVVVTPIGCGDPDTLPINLFAVREDPNDDALLDEATAMLGLSWESTTYTRGAVVLTLVDGMDTDEIGGEAASKVLPCFRPGVSRRDPLNVAHELGHLLGLDHVCGTLTDIECSDEHNENLMNGDVLDGADLSDSQLDTVDNQARRLARCARR